MKKNKNLNIIIADSHPIVVHGLTSLINETSNLNLLAVSQSGKGLRSLLLSNNPDIIILDLKLTKTNIYRLIKDLVVVHSSVKIIAFTNYTMPKLVQDVMEYGTHAFLSKNASTEEILESIYRVENGERFISSSVYNKNIKSESIDEGSASIPEENFIKFATLTERELDVIILLSRGLTNKEIANSLVISKYTVETHRKNIMKKFNYKTVGQLIYFATQQGLV